MTSLHYACRDGDIDLVRDIVEGKNGHVAVELDAADNCGRTPLHIAAKWARLEVAKFLVERGANVAHKDQRSMTTLDVATDEKTRLYLKRLSFKHKEEMADDWARRKVQAREYASMWETGEITDIECEHVLQRLEMDYLWEDTRKTRVVNECALQENKDAESVQAMKDLIEQRPAELQAEAYERSMLAHKKRQIHEKKEREEQQRLAEIKRAEERREKERRKAERREKKDLRLERTCSRCGQIYTNETNRDGQCAHLGKWSPWGTDKKGNKVEWEFFWTCCKSTTLEGPCYGQSICARSDPHEESEADIMRRQAKLLKKLSIEQSKH